MTGAPLKFPCSQYVEQQHFGCIWDLVRSRFSTGVSLVTRARFDDSLVSHYFALTDWKLV